MSSILSQDEVNALLRGVVSGEIETETGKDEEKGAKKFDFSSQDRIIRGRMPTLEIINERFSRTLRSTLSLALGKMIDVSVVSYKTTKFSEFMKGVPVPASFNILKFDPLRGHIMMIVDPNLVFMLVDMFFGGSGQTHVKVEGRDFTFIEQRIVRKVVEIARIEMEKSWSPVVPLELTYVRSEVNPQFASIVPPTEIVIVINLNIETENFSGSIHLCLPYSTIEPIKEKLYAGFQSEQLEIDHRWVGRLKDLLHKTEVELIAELGTSEIRVKELTTLKVGDVIVLDKDVTDDLKVLVQGIPKYRGKPGIFNKKPAVKITSFITEEESNV